MLLSLLFLIPRLALLFVRQPFFDELYTRWIGAKPFGEIVAALHYDSGPPLYYFLVHALGNPPVPMLRAVSLLFAFGAFLLVLQRSAWAAALLAVYPPAVLLSVDARAYALCAFFVAVGVEALECGDGVAAFKRGKAATPSPHSKAPTSSARIALATVAFVLGAYCHYYGVLFFPLLLLRGRKGFLAAVGAGLAYVPVFLLARHQPVAATGWNQFSTWRAVTNLSFAGRYPWALLLGPPAYLSIAALVVLVIAGARSWRFAVYFLGPVALAFVFAAAGRRIYFPLRFESVIAVPLMLWLASSLERWPRGVRIALASALMATGVVVLVPGIANHASRRPDGCVNGTAFIRDHVPPDVPVLASAYCYLYGSSELGSRVTPFPLRQGLHPGWWEPLPPAELSLALRELPRGEFVWLGETVPEMGLILQHRRVEKVVALDPSTRLLQVGADTLH